MVFVFLFLCVSETFSLVLVFLMLKSEMQWHIPSVVYVMKNMFIAPWVSILL